MYICDFVPIKNSWMQHVWNDTTLAKGKDYANQDRVRLTCIKKDTDTIKLQAQVISESERDIYEVCVDFNEDGEPAYFDCECPAFEKYEGICKHCIATILTYNRFYSKVVVPKLAQLNDQVAQEASQDSRHPEDHISGTAETNVAGLGGADSEMLGIVMPPSADKRIDISKYLPESARRASSATKDIENTVGTTTTIGQNSRGVMSIGKGIPLPGNAGGADATAEYYRLQHERQVEEAQLRRQQQEEAERERKQQLALKKTNSVLDAYRQIVLNEVKSGHSGSGSQKQAVTLVPVLDMDRMFEGILLGFQIRRRSKEEMAVTVLPSSSLDAANHDTSADSDNDSRSPGTIASPDEAQIDHAPVNSFPRTYVVKSIDDFMSTMYRHEQVKYGKELSFKADVSSFDPVSQRWLDFIERRYNECIRISGSISYLYSTRARRIKLTDAALDEIFERFSDARFRMGDNGPNYERFISTQKPNISISLSSAQDGSVKVSCDKLHSLYLGSDSTNDRLITNYQYGANWMTGERRPAKPPQHVYYKDDHRLMRFSAEATAVIAPLLLGLRDERGELTFPKEQVPDLIAHVLPEVSKYITVLGASELWSQGVTESMSRLILLDAPDRERVTAILLAGYHGIWLDMHSGQAVGKAEPESVTHVSWDIAGLDAVDIKRDYHAEQRFLAQTCSILSFRQADIVAFLMPGADGRILAGSQEEPLVVKGNDKLYHLLKDGVPRLQALGDVLVTQKMRNLTVEPPRKVEVGVTLDSGLLKLSIDTGGIDIQEMHALMRAYHEKKNYFRLKSGGFIDFSNASGDAFSAMDELGKIEQGLQLSEEQMLGGEVEVPAFRAMYLDGLFNDAVSLGCRKDKAFEALTKRIREYSSAAFPVPETLKDVLRPYQKTGYQWLRCLELCSFCGILADDMGLGKSVQFLAVLLAHYNTAPNRTTAGDKDGSDGSADSEGLAGSLPSLIVCPSSLVLNWKKEAEKFAPSLAVRVIQGTQAERLKLIHTIGSRELVITSYDLLRRDEEEYKDVVFHYFAIDEAQYIKNYTTQAAKAVKKINCKQRFALTGTPIENRLSELWSIFDFLMPGYLYRYSRFKQQFEAPITKDNDETAKNNLRRMILPFVLRRLKSEVLTELPPKTTTVVPVELSEKQMELYNATLLTGLQALKSSEAKTEAVAKIQALALLTKLRRLCCAPSLCFDTFKYGSSKLDVCTELLEQSKEGGHRVLLFSQYTDMLDLIEARVQAAGLSYHRLQGSTPVKDRLGLVETFNKGETDVFLISLKAGGTGLNLTAADTVIHYDPWWNLAAQDQATDRAYRIGQEKKVQVYKLIAQNTIEEKILKLQEMKKDLAAIVDSDNDEGNLMSMSTDEIVNLLRDR